MNNDFMNELAQIEIKSIVENGVLDVSSQPFVMAYNSFILNEKYTMPQKMVFLGLKSYGGSKNNCYPGHARLSRELYISVSTVKRTLNELEELGAILIINRYMESKRKTSNLYILSDIDMYTGNFISSSLDIYRPLKNNGVKVKGK